MGKRVTFSKEFKIEAVRLLDIGKKSAVELALELGVRRNQLYKWKEQLSEKKHGRIGVRHHYGQCHYVTVLKRCLTPFLPKFDYATDKAMSSTRLSLRSGEAANDPTNTDLSPRTHSVMSYLIGNTSDTVRPNAEQRASGLEEALS